MKITNLTLVLLFTTSILAAQKPPTVLATNLNSSKSNVYRLIYPGHFFSSEKALAFLHELENAQLSNQRTAKGWIAQNMKRYAKQQDVAVQVSFFTERQYKDCSNCKKYCKGRCVQDPGADCVCISHSEPNLRTVGGSGDFITVILLSEKILDEQTSLAQVEAYIVNRKPVIRTN